MLVPMEDAIDDTVAKLWAQQNRHQGDRERLFAAVAGALEAGRVLYPGSFVDVAPSFSFADVTYVDSDRRASRFFARTEDVDRLIARHRESSEPATWRFLAADYTEDLAVEDASVDLLISLYAGLVSASCTRYLRLGGVLLANPSHGDVAKASIDPRYELAGVVTTRAGGTYGVRTTALDGHLVPKNPGLVLTDAMIHERGRGIAYTRSAFAYLFRRVS